MLRTVFDYFRFIKGKNTFLVKMKLLLKGLIFLPFATIVLLLNGIMVYWGGKKHYHFYKKNDLKILLEKIGFKDIIISETLSNQDWLIVAVKKC